MIKSWYDNLPSKDKTKTKTAITITLLLVIVFVVYSLRSDKTQQTTDDDPISEITLGNDLLDDDIRAEVKAEIDDFRNESETKNQRIEQLEAQLTSVLSEQQALKASENQIPSNDGATINGVDSFPSPPPLRFDATHRDLLEQSIQPPPTLVGGIARQQGKAPTPSEEDKKKVLSVKLAPGFMEGMLLTGVEALSSEGAQGDPEPILVRVQAPTVLPNEVRANLVGCFVVANAFGVLAKEKVEARLVSLTCMNPKGEVMIDEEIKGYLADASGKKGIAAIVSAKQGTHLARAMIAGIFGGLGDAVSISNTTQSTSALGTTQVIDTDKALESGLARGFKDGTAKIQDIFLELAKNTAPTMEVGAAAKVTVVLTQTITLKVGAS